MPEADFVLRDFSAVRSEGTIADFKEQSCLNFPQNLTTPAPQNPTMHRAVQEIVRRGNAQLMPEVAQNLRTFLEVITPELDLPKSSDIEMYDNAQDEGLLRFFMEQMRIRQLANTQAWINGALSGEGEELVRVHRELTDPDFREEIFVKMATIFTNPDAAVLMREYHSHLVGPIQFLEAGTSKGPRDFPMQAGVSLPLAGYLYGPLSHELYHINRGGVSAFIDGAFDDDRLGSALQEERYADEFAAHKINAAIRTGRDLELEGAREEFVLYQEFARRFFSDFTLAKRLDNLRGVFPYAHAIQIDYVPNRVCGDGGVEAGLL